jgi:hypothetical protein
MGVVFTNAIAPGSPRRTSRRHAFHVVIIARTVVLLAWPETIVVVVTAIVSRQFSFSLLEGDRVKNGAILAAALEILSTKIA